MISLNLNGLKDPDSRDNFQKIQDFLNNLAISHENFQAVEIYVTQNTTGLKIDHKLGGVPLDIIVTRLIAPSAARLIPQYSEFTKDAIYFDISGLASGESLNARLLVGTFSNVVSVGGVVRGDSETMQFRGKF